LPCAFHLSVGCFSPKTVFALSVPYRGQAPGRGKMAPNFFAIFKNAKFYNFTVSQNCNKKFFLMGVLFDRILFKNSEMVGE
jgi:hypothetical protein